jgi:hypothetical protein
VVCRLAARFTFTNCLIAAMPATGPAARIGKAHRHPTAAASGGMSWMEAIVSKNPIEV